MKQNNQHHVISAFARKVALAICFLGITTFAFAQSQVQGTVKDANGQPVIGATVIVDGTTTGTTTDADGRFVLTVGEQATLTVSYLGYKDAQVAVAGKTAVEVTLQEDAAMLDDVVVVGYGTMKRSDLTGSTTSLRSEEITSVLAANPIEALQGKSTGVAVFTNNQPGEAPTLRIRGSASINAGTDPLYVVDGFPLTDGNMNDFNPADVESIEVLKDASATAIYGSRGANGVVMITTKKGTEGRHNISFHANVGVQQRARLLETISGQDFVDYINTATVNQGGSKPFPNGYNGPFYNWQEEIIQKTALTQDYGVTLDGAAKDTRYMFSAGYYNQDGLIESQGFEKVSLHTNLEHDFNKWFSIGANMQFTTGQQSIQTDPITNDIFRYGWPTDPLYKEDGSFNIVQHGEAFNPLADIAATDNRRKTTRFIGNFFAQVNFTDHFNYRLNIGYDTKNTNQYAWLGSQTAKGIQKGSTNGTGTHTWGRNESRLMDNIFTYSNQWGDHRMSLTGVYSWQDYKYNMSTMSGLFSNDAIAAHDFAAVDQSSLKSDSDYYSNRLISWTARATYAFKDKYLLTATIRFDGSSRFGADSKWGTFPSVGLAWRVTEEGFLKDNDVVTNLKIRGSYGVTGNQEIGNYQSLARLASASGDSGYSDGQNTIQGFYESVGNSKLKWEKTTQLDLGFDLTLWDRLDVNFDYYNRQTSDLLYSVPIPSTSGYSSVLSNVGEVSNQGIELSLNADLYRSKDWTVSVGGNFTYNTNEIKKLYDGADRVTVNDGTGTTGLARILEVGNPVNGVYAWRSLGIIKSEQELNDYIAKMPKLAGTVGVGSEMYEDVNGDGNLSVLDAQCIGSVEPTYFYGFNASVRWKELKLAVYGQGAWDYASMAGAEDNATNGSKWAIGYQNTGNYAMWANNTVRNQTGLPTKDGYKDMWSPSNPNGSAPMAGAAGVKLSDRTNADWAYFILKNVQLSYDFSKLINSKYIKGLVFNVNFQNFGTWANHIGYNPENGDVSNPYARIIMFGVNAKF